MISGKAIAASLLVPAAAALSFVGTALAGPMLDEITSSLDRAQEPAEFARQADLLKDMMAGGKLEADAHALTQLSRASYLMGEAEKDKLKKSAYLDSAVDAADRALKQEPGAYRALYWRSMALLLKADAAGGLKALGMVKEALRGLEAVSGKDAGYDSAGAYRSRGKVLIDAPAWAFIGDKKKGLALLLKAKELSPGCLLNRLYLAEAYYKNGRAGEARAEIEYIMAAPVGRTKPKDDLQVKEDAGRLLHEISKD